MKTLSALFAVLLVTACGPQDVRPTSAPSCGFTSEQYVATHFDCGDYSIEHVFCFEDFDRPGCVDMAPETLMGHCVSYNICED